jgi:hypothetical protein
LNFGKDDHEFISKFTERLVELSKENSPIKLYNKEIAFGLSNLKNEESIPALIDLMSYNYYGVRFAAAEGLKINPEYYKYIKDAVNSENEMQIPWLQAFLYSLANVPDEYIEEPVNQLLKSDNEAVLACIAELMREKTKSTKNEDTKKWERKVIKDIETKIGLKNK